MNYPTIRIGTAASVASQITSNNAAIRPEKILDVLAVNNTGGTLYMQYFENALVVPADTTVPDLSFPVFAKSGGTLGKSLDIMGGIWAWSSTDNVLTAAGASGSIEVILKG